MRLPPPPPYFLCLPRWLRPCCVLVALLLPATTLHGAPARPALAAEAKKERVARVQFDKAEQAFNLGKFREALRGYEAAYAAMPLPAFLFNIAQCQRNLNNHERALFFYQRYLNLESAPPNKRIVQGLIVEEQQRLREEEAAVAQAEAATTVPRPSPMTPTVANLLVRPTRDEEAANTPLYTRPWFLGTVGATVVLGAAATFFLLRSSGGDPKDLGTINVQR